MLHDQKKGYQPPIIFKTGSSQAPQGLSMTIPTNQGGPGGQQDQGHGVVLGEDYQQLLEMGGAKYLKGQYDPHTNQGGQVDQVDSKIKDMGIKI